MPYTLTPPWAHRTLYAVRAAAYSSGLAAGFGALVLTPTSIADALSTALTDTWGIIAMLGAGIALYGAMRERYRWEAAGLPLLGAGMLVYGITVWSLLPSVPTRLAQSGTIGLVLCLLLIRSIDLLLVWLRARRDHRDQQTLRAAREAIAAADAE